MSSPLSSPRNYCTKAEDDHPSIGHGDVSLAAICGPHWPRSVVAGQGASGINNRLDVGLHLRDGLADVAAGQGPSTVPEPLEERVSLLSAPRCSLDHLLIDLVPDAVVQRHP